MSRNYYRTLLDKAMASDSTVEDRLKLLHWLDDAGYFWNGEFYDASIPLCEGLRDIRLYPVYSYDKAGHVEIIDARFTPDE